MDDLLDALARLNAHVENLESRVSALEHPSKATFVRAEPVAARPAEALPFAQASGVFPVLGKAMLGIAGAFLLRAVSESGSFPKLAIAVLALAYAAMWLVWATLVPAEAFFARAAYAITAALILAPMLWELTLRFKVLPTSASASVLGTYAIAASVLAWKRGLVWVVGVATVAAVLTTLALLVATNDLVPFVCALLLMALASEAAAGRNHWLGLRPLVAVAADLATWILLYIYSRPESARVEYKNAAIPVVLALGCIPFLIYGASTAFRTIGLHHRLSVFEIGQTVIAFLLAALSVLRFGGDAGAPAFGALCVFLSIVGYTVAFACLESLPEQRNFHVYATWSAALVLGGSFLCLPPLLLALCLSVAAIVATLLGVRASRLTLEFHGLAYLAAAAYASGLLGYAGRVLAGTFPAAPGWTVWMVAASAVLCYAAGGRCRAERWNQRLLQLLSAILAVAAVSTFLVSVLVWGVAAGMTPSASQVAVIRTLITCVVALALAFSASRWQRTELVWIAYGTLALVTAKLLAEDLRAGHPASTSVSIFLYALALIFVPRMTRVRRPKQ